MPTPLALYRVGQGLLVSAALVVGSLVLDFQIHGGDDTGTSGGFDGLFVLGLFPCCFSFILAGILSMVAGPTTGVLGFVIAAILNGFSVFLHIYAAWNFTGWQTPPPGASDAITRRVGTAWIKLVPELLGIVLSLAGVAVAVIDVALVSAWPKNLEATRERKTS